MPSKYVIFSVLSVILIIVSFLLFRNQNNESSLTINNHKIFVEEADTNSKRSKGLSEREKLEENHGMLFIFPSSGYHNFWMYKMKFPLDFIWINSDKVVDITENVPYPLNNEIPLTFTAKSEFNKVLEVNGSKIKDWGIKVGDKVAF